MTERCKVVFLDIDGVLNNQAHLMQETAQAREIWRRDVPELPYRRAREICPTLVGNLNALHERTGCKYVLSSSWRLAVTVDAMQTILEYHGFTGKIIGQTPSVLDGRIRRGRGDEIQEWLDKNGHKVEEFVILDDSADMFELTWKLVRTSIIGGLLPEHVDRAERVLNGDPDAGEKHLRWEFER